MVEDNEAAPPDNDRPLMNRDALNHFVALLAQRQRLGLRRVRRANGEAVPSHDSLMASLQEQGLISTPQLLRAMSMVKRGDFVPQEHQREAFLDSPIRVHAHQFNISAPHIHARALDALDLQSGEHFLDVGSGTGLMAVYGSLLVGLTGQVLSMDVKDSCIDLSKQFLLKLREGSEEYCKAASMVDFQLGDIFIPRSHLDGHFEKIYIGAACPSDRLLYLTNLLKSGGSMVVPSESEFLLIRKRSDGSLSRACLTSVSFTPLDVPTDDVVVSALIAAEAKRIKHIPTPPSTIVADVGAALAMTAPSALVPEPCEIDVCSPQAQAARKADDLVFDPQPSIKRHKSAFNLTPLAITPTSSASSKRFGLVHSWLCSIAALRLGHPDFTLTHRGLHYPAHKELLRVRGKCFQALFGSGMRDADSKMFKVQHSFSPSALESFLVWIYTDQLTLRSTSTLSLTAMDNADEADREAKEIIDIAMVSQFFGAEGLVVLCERKLVSLLDHLEPESSGSRLAPQLLMMAMSMGLRGLEANALDYIAEHYEYEMVEGGSGWSELDREAIKLVARHLAKRLQCFKNAMKLSAGMRGEMPREAAREG